MHIVFHGEDAVALAKSFELDASLDAPIMTIQDDFSFGPIFEMFSSEEMAIRESWWMQLFPETSAPANFLQQLEQIKEELGKDDAEKLWIWVAPNNRDVAGYYALVAYLKEMASRIEVIFLNNLPFINEKGSIFYPDFLSEISAPEFIKAKKLVRPISPTEIELDPDEWNRLCKEEKNIRTYEGGKKLIARADDFYDSKIKESINLQWQKATKIIQAIQAKCKMKQNESFILSRIYKLIEEEVVESKGDISNKKEWEFKKAEASGKSE